MKLITDAHSSRIHIPLGKSTQFLVSPERILPATLLPTTRTPHTFPMLAAHTPHKHLNQDGPRQNRQPSQQMG